jgi:hypothetical protein
LNLGKEPVLLVPNVTELVVMPVCSSEETEDAEERGMKMTGRPEPVPIALALRIRKHHLGLNSGSAIFSLCDLGQ